MPSGDKSYAITWLRRRLATRLNPFLGEAYLFGSFVESSDLANDCDVLFILNAEEISGALPVIAQIEKDFQSEFELPLHATRLTAKEMPEFEDFLSTVQARKVVRIYP